MISKTSALKIARHAVSVPERRSATDWIVIGPRRDGDPSGPYTEQKRSHYQAARELRARWVASVALHAMGMGTDDALAAIYYYGPASAGALVEVGRRAHKAANRPAPRGWACIEGGHEESA